MKKGLQGNILGEKDKKEDYSSFKFPIVMNFSPKVYISKYLICPTSSIVYFIKMSMLTTR